MKKILSYIFMITLCFVLISCGETDEVKSYNIKFVNEGTVLVEMQVKQGDKIEYTGSTPTKADDDNYTYSFAGWSPALTSDTKATKDETYQAQFTASSKQPIPEVINYKITFVNHDGTVLQEKLVEKDAVITYTGPTPTKEEDEQYKYVHNGWEPSLNASTVATEDMTFTAKFSKIIKPTPGPEPQTTYTIQFIIDEENYITIDVPEGELIVYPEDEDPTIPDDDEFSYEFTGWYPELDEESFAHENATYYAQFIGHPLNPDIPTEAIDIISNEEYTGTSYKSWTYNSSTGVNYDIQSAFGNDSIQIRSDNSKGSSGIVTTNSIGVLDYITISFNPSTAAGRVVGVYASNEPFTLDDMYNGNVEKVGEIDNESGAYFFEEEYQYVGLRSEKGAIYIDLIYIHWATGSNDDPEPEDGLLENIISGLRMASSVLNSISGHFANLEVLFNQIELMADLGFDEEGQFLFGYDLTDEDKEQLFRFYEQIESVMIENGLPDFATLKTIQSQYLSFANVKKVADLLDKAASYLEKFTYEDVEPVLPSPEDEQDNEQLVEYLEMIIGMLFLQEDNEDGTTTLSLNNGALQAIITLLATSQDNILKFAADMIYGEGTYQKLLGLLSYVLTEEQIDEILAYIPQMSQLNLLVDYIGKLSLDITYGADDLVVNCGYEEHYANVEMHKGNEKSIKAVVDGIGGELVVDDNSCQLYMITEYGEQSSKVMIGQGTLDENHFEVSVDLGFFAASALLEKTEDNKIHGQVLYNGQGYDATLSQNEFTLSEIDGQESTTILGLSYTYNENEIGFDATYLDESVSFEAERFDDFEKIELLINDEGWSINHLVEQKVVNFVRVEGQDSEILVYCPYTVTENGFSISIVSLSAQNGINFHCEMEDDGIAGTVGTVDGALGWNYGFEFKKDHSRIYEISYDEGQEVENNLISAEYIFEEDHVKLAIETETESLLVEGTYSEKDGFVGTALHNEEGYKLTINSEKLELSQIERQGDEEDSEVLLTVNYHFAADHIDLGVKFGGVNEYIEYNKTENGFEIIERYNDDAYKFTYQDGEVALYTLDSENEETLFAKVTYVFTEDHIMVDVLVRDAKENEDYTALFDAKTADDQSTLVVLVNGKGFKLACDENGIALHELSGNEDKLMLQLNISSTEEGTTTYEFINRLVEDEIQKFILTIKSTENEFKLNFDHLIEDELQEKESVYLSFKSVDDEEEKMYEFEYGNPNESFIACTLTYSDDQFGFKVTEHDVERDIELDVLLISGKKLENGLQFDGLIIGNYHSSYSRNEEDESLPMVCTEFRVSGYEIHGILNYDQENFDASIKLETKAFEDLYYEIVDGKPNFDKMVKNENSYETSNVFEASITVDPFTGINLNLKDTLDGKVEFDKQYRLFVSLDITNMDFSLEAKEVLANNELKPVFAIGLKLSDAPAIDYSAFQGAE